MLAQTLTGLGFDCKVDVEALWQASDLVDEHIGDELIAPLAPRIAARAAEYGFPPGIVAALDAHLQTYSAGDLLDEVLDELARIRQELGSPPLASPIAQILGWQALLHILSANRYQTVVDELPPLVRGEYGRTPDEIDPTVKRAIELRSSEVSEAKPEPTLDELRERYAGWRRATRSCCCCASSTRRPSRSCARSAAAPRPTSSSSPAPSSAIAPSGSATSSRSSRRRASPRSRSRTRTCA